MGGPTEGGRRLTAAEKLAVVTGRPVLVTTTYAPGSVVPEPGETNEEAAIRTRQPVLAAIEMRVVGQEGARRIGEERERISRAMRGVYCFEGRVAGDEE